MNVYDFDGTLYDGDSTVDFYLFCARKHPGVLRALPQQAAGVFRYKLGRCTKTRMKQEFYSFFRYVPDIDEAVTGFWCSACGKLKRFYEDVRRPDDVVASASPEFLLLPACKMLGVNCLIASNVDKKTGMCKGENCRGAEKLRRIEEALGPDAIDAFYSDSKADIPAAAAARTAYLVKGNEVLAWPYGQ